MSSKIFYSSKRSFQKIFGLFQTSRRTNYPKCILPNQRSSVQSFHQPQRAALSISLLVVIAISGSFAIYQLSHVESKHTATLLASEEKSSSAHIIDSPFRVANMPTIAPGRPETLTPEETLKLKEFWGAALSVFGVHNVAPVAVVNGNVVGTVIGEDQVPPAVLGRDRASTIGSEKKKKKRMSFFSRKQKDDDETPEEELSGMAHADQEDKYGQTKEFKIALASQSPADLRKAFWSMVKHDNPDGLLLRFLRARKWDVQKALVMMVSTMHWRSQEMHVDDDIMKNGEGEALKASRATDSVIRRGGEDFLAQERMGKSFLHGTDREGRPICLVRVRLHRQGEQIESSLERYTVFVIETARLLLSSPVDTAAIVFDMTGFSMANMDYGPVKFMIKCFEANYPESLGVVLVHRSPWIFQGIWNIIKGWLDPVVAAKVHFTRTVDELEHYIPRTHIIKELGGDEDWTYQYIEPKDDENDQMSKTSERDVVLEHRDRLVEDLERVTISWMNEKDSTDETTKQRSEISEQLRKNYWQLDPYLRARSIYDRFRVIKGGGRIDFYPQHTLDAPALTENGSHPDDVD